MIEELLLSLYTLEEIDAILLGGSRATGQFDETSDYDLYVYSNKPLSLEKRKAIIAPYVEHMEYNNHFWEMEDDGILLNGIEIELIYREKDSIKDLFDQIKNGSVSHGYSTAFIDNLLVSQVLFDKTGEVTSWQSEYAHILDEPMIQSIVDYNFPIIKDRMPALYNQVKKAVERNDLHSINHRLTEYFSIYYDILFAINKETHKGEKRLLTFHKGFKHQPKDGVLLIEAIFKHVFHDNEKMLADLFTLSNHLEQLLKDLNYI